MTKTFENDAAQGDLLIRRIDKLPDGIFETQQTKERPNQHIVAHSETGHHHVIDKVQARFYEDPKDNMICYLKVDGEYADLKHLRDFDTHETLRIPNGIFELRRQQEYTPEGWRKVED